MLVLPKSFTFLFISFCLFFLVAPTLRSSAQPFLYHDSVMKKDLAAYQSKAIALVNATDTSKPSPHWPSIVPHLFWRNVRQNVLQPQSVNQGKSTNFCGYAAFTHILVSYRPDIYVATIIQLYTEGKAAFPKKKLHPDNRVKKAAGTLRNKGVLDANHADQLWFLTLADQFKGYLNWIDQSYKPGDENTLWAATNFSKFNRMLRVIGDYTLEAAGSDMLRPMRGNTLEYLQAKQQEGIVLLYLNSKFLHPTRFTLFKLRAPTHFVVLYEVFETPYGIEFKYWDYGLKTAQQLTPKRLRKIIFGISTIIPGHEK